MRRSFPFILFVLVMAAALPAQAQLLKKLEDAIKARVPGAAPAAGNPTPAAGPKPAPGPDDGTLPPPAPGSREVQPGYLGVEGGTDPAGGVRVDGFKEAGKAKTSGL